MIFPVVLLQDSQGTLEQVLVLAVVTQVFMRIAQICQSPCYFGMIFPVVLLLDSQGTLEQVLLLPVVCPSLPCALPRFVKVAAAAGCSFP